MTTPKAIQAVERAEIATEQAMAALSASRPMTMREKQLERALSLVLDTLEDERKSAAMVGRDSAIVSALSKYVRTIIEIGAPR